MAKKKAKRQRKKKPPMIEKKTYRQAKKTTKRKYARQPTKPVEDGAVPAPPFRREDTFSPETGNIAGLVRSVQNRINDLQKHIANELEEIRAQLGA